MGQGRIISRPAASEARARNIYTQPMPYTIAEQPSRCTAFCMWAEQSDFNPLEYLLPVIEVESTIRPYAFEAQGAAIPPPSKADIERFAPWHYLIEFPEGVATRAFRMPEEWTFHHHRTATLVEFADRLYGDARKQASVLDVASHCGVFSLEFASRGFGSVRGVDLRRENIEQAEFLKQHFRVPNAAFKQLNARDVAGEEPANIVFCGGLLYHVTFPHELMIDLAKVTKDILIFDTLCLRHPFSGFHYIGGKDVDYSAEGETFVEFMPTYRVVIDMLQAAGFTQLYELLGTGRADVPFYSTGNVRSFVAARDDNERLRAFVAGLEQGEALQSP
jgi:2-polyprenyl-3-methyl-5-hydroxy-6-metoxy-1,4-benzoquinol methylase